MNPRILVLSVVTATATAQAPQFDVVSIKPHKSGDAAGSDMRTLPDGTFRMINLPISTILMSAAPEPVREVSGYPQWVKTEPYDIIAKPGSGTRPTREQQTAMLRHMIVERMKVSGHIEEVERSAFALVVARSDGRLGPDLKKSTLDCAAPQTGPNRCGVRKGTGVIESKGITLQQLAPLLTALAGGYVSDRTGLEGWYALSLRYAPTRLSADSTLAADDAPQFFTALQEQLGLKLVPEKLKVKVFVVDHIERPTPN